MFKWYLKSEQTDKQTHGRTDISTYFAVHSYQNTVTVYNLQCAHYKYDWAHPLHLQHVHHSFLAMNNTLLHCTSQHFFSLYCTALHFTVLHCIALHCTVLHFTALNCTALHCTALYYTALHYTALHFTSLHCTALGCTALQHCIITW